MAHKAPAFLGAALLLAAGAAWSALSFDQRLPSAPRCPLFPRTNQWNLRVDRLPVAARSDAIVRAIGRHEGLHADFGSGRYEGRPIGIPYTTVPRR